MYDKLRNGICPSIYETIYTNILQCMSISENLYINIYMKCMMVYYNVYDKTSEAMSEYI